MKEKTIVFCFECCELKLNWIPTMPLISVRQHNHRHLIFSIRCHVSLIRRKIVAVIQYKVDRLLTTATRSTNSHFPFRAWVEDSSMLISLSWQKQNEWMHQQTNENGFSWWNRDQHIEWKLIAAPYASNCINSRSIAMSIVWQCTSSSHSTISLEWFLNHLTVCVCMCAFVFATGIMTS